MQHFNVFRRGWAIGLLHDSAFLGLEVTDDVSEAVRKQVMWAAFAECPLVSISQYVDSDQWPAARRGDLALRLRETYGAEVRVTTGLSNLAHPAPGASIYAMHVVCSPSQGLFQDALGLGMTGVPNTVHWLSERHEWSGQVVAWNSKMLTTVAGQETTRAEGLGQVIQERRFLAVTVDGHPCFMFTELGRMHQLLEVVERYAKLERRELRIQNVSFGPTQLIGRIE